MGRWRIVVLAAAGLAACATSWPAGPALRRTTIDEPEEPRPQVVVVERNPYWVNFVPFGAGQFQNRHRRKGAFFATTEGVTAVTSAVVWMYLVNEYGCGGVVPASEAGDVRRLQQLGIGASAAFFGLAVWGVVDAIVHHKPIVPVSGP